MSEYEALLVGACVERSISVLQNSGGKQDDGVGWEFDDEVQLGKSELSAARRVVVSACKDGTPAHRSVLEVRVNVAVGMRREIDRERRPNAFLEWWLERRIVLVQLAEVVMI